MSPLLGINSKSLGKEQSLCHTERIGKRMGKEGWSPAPARLWKSPGLGQGGRMGSDREAFVEQSSLALGALLRPQPLGSDNVKHQIWRGGLY